MDMMKEKFEALAAPFPEACISWRVGSKKTVGDVTYGRALPYLDARDVQNRLDQVLGPENWCNTDQEVATSSRLLAVRCKLMVRINGEWIGKEDGAALEPNSQEAERDMSVKGAYSEALKRAAVLWGVGRYLYDYEAPWIALTEDKQLSEVPRLPAAFLPPEEAAAREKEPAVQPTVPPATLVKEPASVSEEKPAMTQVESAEKTSPVAQQVEPEHEEHVKMSAVLMPSEPSEPSEPSAPQPVSPPAEVSVAPVQAVETAQDDLSHFPEQERINIQDILKRIQSPTASMKTVQIFIAQQLRRNALSKEGYDLVSSILAKKMA